MTVQDLKTPPPKSKQLSETAIRELIRPHIPHAIERLIELMDTADNDSVKIGAVKILLSKVVPDLKSTEFNGEGAKALAGLLTVIAQRGAVKPVAESSTL